MKYTRVLLFSEGFGTGHTQAAYALAKGMQQMCPDVHCRVMELGHFLNPTVAPMIQSAYRKTVSEHPQLVGKLYRSGYAKSLNRLTRLMLHRIFYAQAERVIEQLKPDVIICTHPIPNAVVSRLKRQGLPTPLYTLITDYDAHGTWVNPEVDQYLVSTPHVKNLLMQRGVEPEYIHVTGIPVHPKFWERRCREQLHAELHIKDMPTILIMGGGWGLIFNQELTRILARRADDIQLIFCMGDNEKQIADMREDPLFRHPHIHVFGYRDDIHKLMDVSDLLITKPGGMTCTEGAAKGIPMLFYEPIPGQEEENCQYFVSQGLGEVLDSPAVIHKWLDMLAHRDKHAAEYRNRAVTLPIVTPSRCASHVLALLEDRAAEPYGDMPYTFTADNS
ncbi:MULTISPECIES: MGDG synthase family glycosyltransferase [Paenibacillus]|uniref:UDP-N-acetylglucosamine--LPS N-acetylglucosamine transferase n=1 Tax=Paenibacillus campinasensis TaxID=66347 RepID=A0A268EY27_9BACL|nr:MULTISPECIES: glycosyltransferase [Paenibacillus]PAD78032.1 UDP-N-acetylglucosamine--LPS N-acetylglucosamine transferase [Paenibacillus campinasensis]PAK52886.1 UDP-N-acetylglucosamine--LPS N-acetylglucosamine transferase [Paenibacillus sp. 7541]